MVEYVICNGIPVYEEAPVSLDILRENSIGVVNALAGNEYDKKLIVIDAKEKEIINGLKDALDNRKDLSIEIIEVNPLSNFVYSNQTALMQVAKGEKPIPSGMECGIYSCNLEELLQKNKKKIYIKYGSSKIETIDIPKMITPNEILKHCKLKNNFKAMYFGYPMGVFLGEEDLDNELEVITDMVTVFDEKDCILDRLNSIIASYAKETCGRCVFCYEGVTQLSIILSDITHKRGKTKDLDLMLELSEMMKEQALCDVSSVVAKTVCSAIEGFRAEIEEHVTKKVCKAEVCSKFVSYHILPELCNGCNECQDECSEDAILGKKRFIHIIDQDECSQCGVCLSVCDENAIVKAGIIKPKCPKKPIPCKR